jgi:hypothetical protein
MKPITDTDRLTFLAEALYRADTFVVDGSINDLRAKIDERIIDAQPHEKILVSELDDLRARAAEADRLAALLQERDARIEFLQGGGEPASLHRAYGP